jgi:hypothetical protein
MQAQPAIRPAVGQQKTSSLDPPGLAKDMQPSLAKQGQKPVATTADMCAAGPHVHHRARSIVGAAKRGTSRPATTNPERQSQGSQLVQSAQQRLLSQKQQMASKEKAEQGKKRTREGQSHQPETSAKRHRTTTAQRQHSGSLRVEETEASPCGSSPGGQQPEAQHPTPHWSPSPPGAAAVLVVSKNSKLLSKSTQ